MLKKTITIINKLGLHARAAAKLVNHAYRYGSEIWISYNGKLVNAKSIMGIMMLALTKGAIIELITEGEDEKEAMDDLTALIENRFDEKE